MTQFETYQHHKGGLYLKLHEALHTETNELMVIYVCSVSGGVFARPKDMFYEDIQKGDYSGPRFKRIPDSDREGAKNFLKSGCKS